MKYIIDMGKTLPNLSDEYKVEENRIHGCQAQVWLNAFEESGALHFEADSDAFITKGIIGLLVKVLSGHSPKDIHECDLYFIEKTGLQVAPLSYPCKRSCFHGEAVEGVCACFSE